MKYTKESTESAGKDLYKYFKEASSNFTHKAIILASIESVSRSGMTRRIRYALAIPTDKAPDIYHITYSMGMYLHSYSDATETVTVYGCGMDMVWNTLCVTLHKLARQFPEDTAFSAWVKDQQNWSYTTI